MQGIRRTPYAVLVVTALASAMLAACGSSGSAAAPTGASSAGPQPGSSTSVSASAPPASGAGDLQLRQASSAQRPAVKPCQTGPVAPGTPTFRCDREGSGFELGPAFVTGAMVASAQAQQTENGPQVEVVLDAAGRKALAAATTRMAPLGPPEGLLGIMSGGRLYGAPLVQTPVLGGVFVIGGLANMPDAVSLAASIRG